jgi:hypothetical protein
MRSFKYLFRQFIAGAAIKRKHWRGYWKYNTRTKNIDMYTKEGKVIQITDTEDILFTLAGVVTDDWEIATNENCDVKVK